MDIKYDYKAEVLVEQCKALISALGNETVPYDDKVTFVCILEDCMEKLDNEVQALEALIERCPMK